MKLFDVFTRLAVITLLAWIGWSLQRMPTKVEVPSYLEVELARPVTIETLEDLSVRGNMMVNIDRMPFDRGDPIHVKFENAPLEVQLDNWTLQRLR